MLHIIRYTFTIIVASLRYLCASLRVLYIEQAGSRCRPRCIVNQHIEVVDEIGPGDQIRSMPPLKHESKLYEVDQQNVLEASSYGSMKQVV